MPEAAWGDLHRRKLAARWGEAPAAEAVREDVGWVEALHQQAAGLLCPEALRARPAHEIYGDLKALQVPGCRLSLVKLGKANEAEAVVAAILRLLETPGHLAEKFHAAKIPQTGMASLTELLCLAKPARFMLRNTAVLRGLAAVVPFYSRRALAELEYEDFLDICRELARVQEALLEPCGLTPWARAHRFLLLYAVLATGRS